MHERAMGPQRTERPQGGFHGQQPGESPEMLSHLERRRREAEEEAQRLVDEARHEAEAMRREAEAMRREAEATQAAAYREGFAQGERAGEKLALQKTEPVMQALQELLNAVGLDRDNMIRQHEQELIKVAMVIAAQTLKTTIELQPEVVASVVEAALAKVGGAQEITLKLASHDYQLLEALRRKEGGTPWPPAHVKIAPDETVGRGGCRIETEAGDIDATIETQLRIMKNALWGD